MKTGTSKSRCRGQTRNKTKNSAVKEVKNSEVLLFDWSLLQDYLEHTICMPNKTNQLYHKFLEITNKQNKKASGRNVSLTYPKHLHYYIRNKLESV